MEASKAGLHAGGAIRLSRKRVLNRVKNIPRDSVPRIARWSPAMETIQQTACKRINMTLSAALLAACIANLVLVCAWF
jgi:hypothetical protein